MPIYENGLSAAQINAGFAPLPATADKVVFVSSRGNDSNDGTTWKSALLTLSAAVTKLGGPGIIEIGQGDIDFGTQVVVDSTTDVWFRGRGGDSSGGTPGTVIRWTGTGGGSAISARDTVGFHFSNIMFLASQATFTGRLIDLRGNSSNSVFAEIHNCYFGNVSGTHVGIGVDVSQTHTIDIHHCRFYDLTDGIRGRNNISDQANNIGIGPKCYFRDNATAHIHNAGDAWKIDSCTWEPLDSGAAGALLQDSGFNTNALNVIGGWCGDVTNAGIQFDLQGGNNIALSGVWLGGNTGSTGLRIRGTASGLNISSYFTFGTNGIDCTGATVSNYDFRKSTFSSVTNSIVAANLASDAPDVQDFATSGNWTFPLGAVMVRIEVWGDGGGGGSGARRASGTLSTGGGGGAGGALTERWLTATQLTALGGTVPGGTIAVTVGTGGAGGAAVTANDTNGNAGSQGGGSHFGATSTLGCFATGGFGGGAGSNAGAGTAGPGPGAGTINGGTGAASSATGLVGPGANSGNVTGGGGAGGGITTGAVAAAGGNGGPSNAISLINNFGAVNTSGTPGTAGFCGGGGGGGASTSGVAGDGGAGATFGGGGGGGGASLNGSNSGKGGNGGAGRVRVTTFF